MKDEYISLKLNGKEKLVSTYYFKDTNEIKNIRYGSEIKIYGSLREASHETIPYNFDYHDYLYYHDVYYTLSVDSLKIDNSSISSIYRFKNKIYSRINNIDDRGYMKAFILGIKSDLDEYTNYQRLGVAHLFALSGMHISLFVLVLNKMLFKLKEKYKFVIISFLLVIYGFIVGFSASILRCVIFFIISKLNKIFKCGLDTVHVLIIVFCMLLFYNPFYLYDIGFIYSFLTVLGIILFSSRCSGGVLRKSLYSSFIAFLFSMPVSLYSFYQINFLSIIYNIFYIPFVSMIIFPLTLITFIFPVFNGLLNVLFEIMEFISSLLVDVDIGIIYMSFNMIDALIFICLLFLFYYFKKMIYVLFLFFSFVLLRPYMDSNSYVYYLDVGQGDSMVIISPYRKKIIMIDTGGIVGSETHVSSKTITMLKALSIKKIDYLILTHGDYDHMGDASYLVNEYRIDNVVFNNGSINYLEGSLIEELEKNKISYSRGLQRIEDDNFNLIFLDTKKYNNENDNSSVIYLDIYGYKFLFMGDSGILREKDIIAKYKIDHIDFLKIGHHGADTSSSEAFVNSIKPLNCVVSVGKKNRYGHPKEKVLDILDDYCDIYRTDIDGSILVKINIKGYKVKIYNSKGGN